MSHDPRDIIETILDRLTNMAKTETVVGEPVTVGEVVILPVIKLSIGFGAGGGSGNAGETAKAAGGTGSGGGGGASVVPVGFLVYDGKEVKFVSTGGKGKFDSLIDTVPEILSKFGVGSKGKGKGRDSKEESSDKTD